MELESLLDSILNYFAGPKFSSELQQAKKEFFEKAGIVDDENYQFEPRMAQFLDWYLFSRDLHEYHLPPIQLINQTDIWEEMSWDQKQIASLATTSHSLYEFLKVRANDVYVRDLFSGKKIVLRDSIVSVGFNPEEVFDARVIPFEGNFYFTKGFCFHPPGARKFIVKEIKKIRHLDQSHHEALMFRLLKMRYKLEQYKHIRMEFIYTDQPHLKI